MVPPFAATLQVGTCYRDSSLREVSGYCDAFESLVVILAKKLECLCSISWLQIELYYIIFRLQRKRILDYYY